MVSLAYQIKEQELDKKKDEIAMQMGYTILDLVMLLNQYKEEERKFQEWVKEKYTDDTNG